MYHADLLETVHDTSSHTFRVGFACIGFTRGSSASISLTPTFNAVVWNIP
jgi:hypothetical protein